MRKLLVIEHDNGIKGQHGFTEEPINSDLEIEAVIESYKECGIVVYAWESYDIPSTEKWW